MARLKRGLWLVLFILALALAACSPEATRDRGQPGGDIGNRNPVVEMHGPTNPFYDTNQVGNAIAVENKR